MGERGGGRMCLERVCHERMYSLKNIMKDEL